MDATSAGSPHRAAAGGTLLVLGGLWFAVGAVLLVLASLYGRGPGNIPGNIDIDPALVGAAPRSAGLGLVAVAAGLGQVTAGFGAMRGRAAWAPRVGVALAAAGAALVAWWLVTGLSAGQPVLVLVPVVAAYLYAAIALAIPRRSVA